MQIIGLHKNVYKLYSWARTQECLDVYRIKYEGQVRHWEALRAEGVPISKWLCLGSGVSRMVHFKQKKWDDDAKYLSGMTDECFTTLGETKRILVVPTNL